MKTPLYVALCGAPGAGKTTVADLLVERYDGFLVDDGKPLREAAMALYGLSWWHVSTQEGKATTRTVCGKTFTVRQLLGDLGNLLEGFYGQQFMPERALAQVDDTVPLYVFPSCRKTQGLTYLKHGGIVVEITRPGHVPVNDFDRYDQSLVTYRIVNDGDLAALQERVTQLFDRILTEGVPA
jgi:hypothetical protein